MPLIFSSNALNLVLTSFLSSFLSALSIELTASSAFSSEGFISLMFNLVGNKVVIDAVRMPFKAAFHLMGR